MHSGSNGEVGFGLVVLAMFVIWIIGGAVFGRKAMRKQGGQVRLDATSPVFLDGGSDTSAGPDTVTPDVSTACDPGHHVGSFDGGCGTHH